MDTKEFLNPGSMLTPGMAGGMTMAMTNVLSGQLHIEAPGPAYLGLGLSFLFGLLVFVGDEISWLKRGVYYVLNSLVIFVVAIGSNTVGQGATAAPPAPRSAAAPEDIGPGVWLTGWIPSAQAQVARQPATAASASGSPATGAGWCCLGGTVKPQASAACGQAQGRWFAEPEAARAACVARGAPVQSAATSSGFFRPWTRP